MLAAKPDLVYPDHIATTPSALEVAAATTTGSATLSGSPTGLLFRWPNAPCRPYCVQTWLQLPRRPCCRPRVACHSLQPSPSWRKSANLEPLRRKLAEAADRPAGRSSTHPSLIRGLPLPGRIGRPRAPRGWASGQAARCTIISLIFPMASAGLSPLGQTSVQFRIVRHRKRR